jgi:hypothetical protein
MSNRSWCGPHLIDEAPYGDIHMYAEDDQEDHDDGIVPEEERIAAFHEAAAVWNDPRFVAGFLQECPEADLGQPIWSSTSTDNESTENDPDPDELDAESDEEEDEEGESNISEAPAVSDEEEAGVTQEFKRAWIESEGKMDLRSVWNGARLTNEQKAYIKRKRDEARNQNRVDRQAERDARRAERRRAESEKNKMRVFSITISFPNRDIPQGYLDQCVQWLLEFPNRSMMAAERGGSLNHRHLQAVAEWETSSAVMAKRQFKEGVGWDVNEPDVPVSICFKELSCKSNAGLHSSFEAFLGYVLKDKGLYLDWQLWKTDLVDQQAVQV